MIRSMTGFATRSGSAEGTSWAWDMRGVNGRGLDLRLRLPDGIDGLEAMVRARLPKRVTRGSITLTLRLQREAAQAAMALDTAQLAAVLGALGQIERAAKAADVTLTAPSSADILAQRGIIASGAEVDTPSEGLVAALRDDLEALIDAFDAMRHEEGTRLKEVILAQLARIEELTAEAAEVADSRRDETQASLTAALRRILDDVTEISEDRLAQELALLATKQDVTEELDRLTAHVAAARDLLSKNQAVGRKLDFLAQEFNREANTLCSKAQNSALTALGLELKATVDQMREQIQNVE